MNWLPRGLAAEIFFVTTIAPHHARAACAPLEITTGPEALSEEWQSAVNELKREVEREGMPWSCAGGTLGIAVDEDGRRAAMRFRNPAGREVVRHVPSRRTPESRASSSR